MTVIRTTKDRGVTRYLTVLDANGDAITVGANDKLRVTIYRVGQDPVFQVTSGSDTANGSSITKNTPSGKNTLRLDASDLSFAPGIYTFHFEYYDNADAQEFKTIDKQVFCLEAT